MANLKSIKSKKKTKEKDTSMKIDKKKVADTIFEYKKMIGEKSNPEALIIKNILEEENLVYL